MARSLQVLEMRRLWNSRAWRRGLRLEILGALRIVKSRWSNVFLVLAFAPRVSSRTRRRGWLQSLRSELALVVPEVMGAFSRGRWVLARLPINR